MNISDKRTLLNSISLLGVNSEKILAERGFFREKSLIVSARDGLPTPEAKAEFDKMREIERFCQFLPIISESVHKLKATAQLDPIAAAEQLDPKDFLLVEEQLADIILNTLAIGYHFNYCVAAAVVAKLYKSSSHDDRLQSS